MPILSSIIEKDIAIDLGTDTTILYVAGIGIRLREPTVVTIDRTTGRVLKVGEDARKMLGRTPGNLVSVHPIAAGVISDYDMTCEMLREFIRRVTSFSLFRSRVLVCVPGSITGVEERAIVNAVIEAGGRKVYLVPSAVATAVGAGLDVNRADGHMIIDIGGGSLLYGIDRLVTERTGIEAHVADDALSCTAYGAGRMLSRLDSMTDGMQNFARQRQLDKTGN